MSSRMQLLFAAAILLAARYTPAQAQDDAEARRRYELGCTLIKQIGEPIERKASRSFNRRLPRSGEYNGYPVYRYTPEPALSVVMVLGEHNKKLVSEASAGKAYLLRHHISAHSIRRTLQLSAQQALPDKIGCDLQEITLKGGARLDALTFSQMID